MENKFAQIKAQAMAELNAEYEASLDAELASNWPEAIKKRIFDLAVQEAVNVCLAQRDPQNLNYKPSKQFADAIKQHFGIY